MLQVGLALTQCDEEVLELGVLGKPELAAVCKDACCLLKCVHDSLANNALEGHKTVSRDVIMELGLQTVSILELAL